MNSDLLQEMRQHGTWRLIFLTIITIFIYPAHYIARQTKVINRHAREDEQIETSIVWILFLLTYASSAFFIAYLFVDEAHPVAQISNGLDKIQSIVFLIWAFAARKRINALTGAYKGSEEWFSGIWTFFFTFFYINYKTNQLTIKPEQGPEVRELDSSTSDLMS